MRQEEAKLGSGLGCAGSGAGAEQSLLLHTKRINN